MHLREEEYDKAATDFFEVSREGNERYCDRLSDIASVRPILSFYCSFSVSIVIFQSRFKSRLFSLHVFFAFFRK